MRTSFGDIQRVPALPEFWDLKKKVLCKIRVSGTVLKTQLTPNSPTCMYIIAKTAEVGDRVSDFCVSGGPLYSDQHGNFNLLFIT